MAPILQTHRFAVDRRVIEADNELVREAADEKGISYSLFFQMTRLTHDRGSLLHDDRLDAVATAIQWLQEQAAQDQKIQMRERATELLHAEFEDETGYALMNLTRQALGMSLEQAKQAEVRGGSRGGAGSRPALPGVGSQGGFSAVRPPAHARNFLNRCVGTLGWALLTSREAGDSAAGLLPDVLIPHKVLARK